MATEQCKKENFYTFSELDIYEALMYIKDSQTKDGVLAYAEVLAATREIFGEENLTENVMIAAIQAGSYLGWRGIMGPKYTEPTRRI